MAAPATTVDVAGHTVRVSNPDKVYFPALGLTKLDLVAHYLAMGEAVLRGVHLRPVNLKRSPDGIEGETFYQKRVPDKRPDWLQTAVVGFPSGRTARELCVADLAHVVWAVNLGCVELHPWAVRRFDLEHPDELRIDLDPQPEVPFAAVRDVAMVVRDVLGEHGLVGWPKTSGSRGIHVHVRLVARWGFDDVRRAAVVVAREVERRVPDLATSAWWKEERGAKVFLDYNQNARDRTVAAAYSVRAVPDARVSAPLRWDEVPDVDPAAFTVATMPARLAEVGDLHAGIDDAPGSLASLLAEADRAAADGVADAPWPPNFPKSDTEGRRVAPSRRRAD